MASPFSQDQLDSLEIMAKECGNADSILDSLDALGLDNTERRAVNQANKQVVANVRAVVAAADPRNLTN